MSESARRGRHSARTAVETLEGRSVLSVSANLSAGGIPLDLGQYGPSNSYLTPQSGEVDLTLTRTSAQARAALTVGVDTEGSYTKVLPPNAHTPHMTRNIVSIGSGPDGRTVQRVLRTTGPNRSILPIVPIEGNYRFAPGQTSLTIPIRLNPRFIPPNGNTDVLVEVHDPTTKNSYDYYATWVHLQIVASLDQIPPKVIGSSRTPGAITLTFSKPMNPATVEDVTNYEVHGPSSNGSQPIPLESAVYNPATQTVTLTPTVPLTQPGYSVGHESAGKSPTDLHGNAADFGIFGAFLP